MATRNVPGTFATIQAAIAASSPGDIIEIAAGYTNESALVTVNNLTFTGPASVTGIILRTDGGDGTPMSIILAGEAPIGVYGSFADETVTGNSGANVIRSGGGFDTLDGGAGADIFVLEGGSGAGGTVNGGTENDIVRSNDLGNFSFSAVETLETRNTRATAAQLSSFASIGDGTSATTRIEIGLRGAGGTIDLSNRVAGPDSVRVFDAGLTAACAVTGSNNADELSGSGFDDTLDGGGGADSLIGLGGNDTYIVDNAADQVFEAAGGGADTVAVGQLVASYTLAAGQQVETLATTRFKGTAAINLTGNEFANTVIGNAGNNILDGGGGADTLNGSLGNDTYIVDTTADKVFEAAGAGTDTVAVRAVSYTLAAGQEIETLATTKFNGTAAINLTGNAFANTIIGNAGANILNGGGGNDTLIGSLGDDTYVTDGGDTITEAANSGIDTVRSSVTYTLGANLEKLTLTGTEAINGTGNALDNALTGNGEANILEGGGGTDSLSGLFGNDTYIVEDAADQVFEIAFQGTDTVAARVSYALAAGQSVETLATTKFNGTAAIDLTGNELTNIIIGNAGANTLNGGGGNDTLRGSQGDDTYIIDGADSIFENANDGIDTVRSSTGYTLGANLENLTLTGTAKGNGTGNTLDNLITGNAAANVLDGGEGADSLTGLGGNDSYVVDNAADEVFEATGGGGGDRVFAKISYTLAAGQEVEFLQAFRQTDNSAIDLTGNELDNTITGNYGVNTLDGRGGNDTLLGSQGRDTLYGGEGSDTFMLGPFIDSIDIIADFSQAQDDQIDLRNFNGDSFIGTSAFTNQAGQVRYEFDGADTRVQCDSDGFNGADIQVILKGQITLMEQDFLF